MKIHLRWLVVLLVHVVSCTAITPSNPFDPSTPPEQQATGSITGTIEIGDAGGLTLVLVDAAGAPVPGTDNQPRTTLTQARAGRTDAADFAFTGLRPGSYRVAPGDDARFKAYQAPIVPLVKLEPGATESVGVLKFTLITEGSGTVRGHVVLKDAAGGSSEIRLYRKLGNSLEVRGQVRTGADGSFMVSSLPPGRYALSAELTGFTPDYKLGFDLGPPAPTALSNDVEFAGNDALKMYPVTAVIVPDLQRSFGVYYTRDQNVALQVLMFGGMSDMRLSTNPAFTSTDPNDPALVVDDPFVPYAAAASVALPDVQGPVSIYGQFRSPADADFQFTSDVFSTTVVRDSIPPVVLRVSARGITPDAEGVLWLRDPSVPVTFDFEGTDAESAVASYAVHHDAQGSSGLPDEMVFESVDAPAGLMREVKTFALTGGNGEKTVWVYLRDRAGNTSEPMPISLRVDSRPPDVGTLIVSNAATGNVIEGTTATIRIDIPADCTDPFAVNLDDCPVAYRLGKKPLSNRDSYAALATADWTLTTSSGGLGSFVEIEVPFDGSHGEVVSFEGDFVDRAGNAIRVASANYTVKLAGKVQLSAWLEGVSTSQPGHAGIAVRLTPAGASPSNNDASTTTTGNGSAAIDDVPVGEYVARFSAVGYESVSLTGIRVAERATTVSPGVTLPRAKGTVTGIVNVSAGSTSLTIGAGERSGAIVVLSGGGLTTPMRAQTDVTGTFSIEGVPVNVGAPYSVTVSKANFTASSAVPANVSDGGVTSLSGLSLTVQASSIPVVVELHDRVEDADPVTYANASATLTGTAFNGATVGPITQTTSASSGSTTFQNLPAGAYSVTATLAQHSTDSGSGIALDAGSDAAKVTLSIRDVAAPSVPTVIAGRDSPTSALWTTLSLLTASVDPTLPSSNLRDYQVQVCGLGGGAGAAGSGSATCTTSSWDGNAVSTFALVSGGSNVITVKARDWNGNESALVTLPSIRAETIPPNMPVNVHVDNRDGSARISWDAATTNGSLPVGGYKVYYGALKRSNPSDFTGDFASQGRSPIDVGPQTSVVLTGLPNGSPFYVSIAAYDTAIDPGPNESPLSGALIVNPNQSPLDRAARRLVGVHPISMASQGDVIFVTTGTSTTAGSGTFLGSSYPYGGASYFFELPPFTITAYRYDSYGDVKKLGSISSDRARMIVADENRLLYAYDPYATDGNLIDENKVSWPAVGKTGIAVYDVTNPSSPVLVSNSSLAGKQITQFKPVHRLGADGKAHHFVTYKDLSTGDYHLSSVATGGSHLDLATTLDGGDANLGSTQPAEFAAVGQTVLVAAGNRVDAYTVADDFSSVARSVASSGTTSSFATMSAYAAQTLTLDYPDVYVSSINTIYRATLSDTAPYVFTSSAFTKILTTQKEVARIRVVGGTMVVAERAGYNTTLVELFGIADPSRPSIRGSYVLNESQETNGELVTAEDLAGTPANEQWSFYGSPGALTAVDFAIHGNNLFILNRPVSLNNHGCIDVVEMGSPRAIRSQETILVGGLQGGSAAIRGSRLIGSFWTNYGGFSALVDVDMHKELSGFAAATPGQDYRSRTLEKTDASRYTPYVVPRTLTTTLAADYAFVATGSTGNQIDVFDVSTPDRVDDAVASVGRLVPVTSAGLSAIVTGIVVQNDYVYASVAHQLQGTTSDAGSAQNYLQRWDLTGLRKTGAPAPVVVQGATEAGGRSIATSGRYIYVGTASSRICKVDAATMAQGGCFDVSSWGSVGDLAISGGHLHVACREAVSILKYALGDESAMPTFVSNVYVYGFPNSLQAYGPTLFTIQYGSGFEGFASYDISGSSASVTGFTQVINTMTLPIGVAGPYLVLPSFSAGTTLYRMY